ncbi:MAG: SBBP repeat-containing protein, partial [Nitrospinae bacterium]|nr:SBBP repeat-containing protein [Nitrospinota bacterium]
NTTGSALVYSTYLGGSGSDSGRGIAVDGTGNAYVTGGTNSTDFPTTPGAFQPTFGGFYDVFVTKLNTTGSALVYSTYLGGSRFETGLAIAVDGTGNAYVTGFNEFADFPTTPEAFQPTPGGVINVFIAKITDGPVGPNIEVKPLIVNFGSVKLGKSKIKSFHIRNVGDAELEITGISGVIPPFMLEEPQPPFTVAPGEEEEVMLHFMPTTRGKARQTIVIESNDPDQPEVELTLQGKGKGKRR